MPVNNERNFETASAMATMSSSPSPPPSQLQLPSPSSCNSNVKTVSFKPTITIVKFHDFGSEHNWLSVPERKQFIVDARNQSKEWATLGYDFLLKDTFHDKSEQSAQDKVDAYAQLPGDAYCRGLERFVCREHGLKRESFKRGAIRHVVAEGRKCRELGIPNDVAWEELGKISRKISSFATRFAIRIGRADELAVFCGEDGSKVKKLLEEEAVNNAPKQTTLPPTKTTNEMEVGANDSANFLHQKQQMNRGDSRRCVTAVNGRCHDGPSTSSCPQQVVSAMEQ